MPKKKKKFLIVIICILLVLAAAAGAVALYVNHTLGKVKRGSLPTDKKSLGISSDTEEKYKSVENKITNIAFFGVDRRNKSDSGSSDSIIILTIDTKHNKVKMTSVMRDTYVHIDGHGKDKITYAYEYGGAALAVKTLNENFNLNIEDYVTVDFFDLQKIIDKLGGVQIDVQPDEIQYMNGYLKELTKLDNIQYVPQTKTGPQVLDGLHAVAYSRIRYTTGGDFVRTERQRTVLMQLLNKVKGGGSLKLASNINDLLPYVETSMTNMEILNMGTDVMKLGVNNIEQERFPIDGYCSGLYVNNVWYLNIDTDVTSKQIDDYIFDDIKPTPKKPLF